MRGNYAREKSIMVSLVILKKVPWRKLVFDNEARPIAVFITWMACRGRLAATKDRLLRFGILDNADCVFWAGTESMHHLMFPCREMYNIW